jgi:hypothetical protein
MALNYSGLFLYDYPRKLIFIIVFNLLFPVVFFNSSFPQLYVSLNIMTRETLHRSLTTNVRYLILDMSDCYTWSFPEFLPFCPQLYYFSTFKDYNNTSRS